MTPVITKPSPNYTPRLDATTGNQVKVEFLIAHFTQISALETQKAFLTPGGVSAHYTVTDTGTIWQHVVESNAAHHAGVSSWAGIHNLNNRSVGIEFVHPGYRWHEKLSPENTVIIPGMREQWYPYSSRQLEVAVPLMKNIIKRHQIPQQGILGHSDIAPDRKIDPGPLFPWEWLSKNHGIGVWPKRTSPSAGDTSAGQVVHLLRMIGYNFCDTMTRRHLERRIRAFQMHWLPENLSGQADEETVWRMRCVADAMQKHRFKP
ncbi:MAG: N-acetylmuramoyl-L-alanine amidase [Alphaproteobacteria bacterium]|nr:MAG: N-acetylmuramoyl-L-alanine amidase [Alphaproteobacteria bacterium]